MTTGRVLVAGLAGELRWFFWRRSAHMVLPLGRLGISEINSNEPAVLDALHTTLGNSSGMYIFPSFVLTAVTRTR